MHFAMNSIMSPRAALAALLMLAACPTAYAQSAYITQVDSHASGAVFPVASQPTQTVPVNQYTPSQTAFVADVDTGNDGTRTTSMETSRRLWKLEEITRSFRDRLRRKQFFQRHLHRKQLQSRRVAGRQGLRECRSYQHAGPGLGAATAERAASQRTDGETPEWQGRRGQGKIVVVKR